MIRMAPEAPPETAEEKNRARKILIDNIATFFVAVAVIRLGKFIILSSLSLPSLIDCLYVLVPHAIKLLTE